jgi:hypothetical protein
MSKNIESQTSTLEDLENFEKQFNDLLLSLFDSTLKTGDLIIFSSPLLPLFEKLQSFQSKISILRRSKVNQEEELKQSDQIQQEFMVNRIKDLMKYEAKIINIQAQLHDMEAIGKGPAIDAASKLINL